MFVAGPTPFDNSFRVIDPSERVDFCWLLIRCFRRVLARYSGPFSTVLKTIPEYGGIFRTLMEIMWGIFPFSAWVVEIIAIDPLRDGPAIGVECQSTCMMLVRLSHDEFEVLRICTVWYSDEQELSPCELSISCMLLAV